MPLPVSTPAARHTICFWSPHAECPIRGSLSDNRSAREQDGPPKDTHTGDRQSSLDLLAVVPIGDSPARQPGP